MLIIYMQCLEGKEAVSEVALASGEMCAAKRTWDLTAALRCTWCYKSLSWLQWSYTSFDPKWMNSKTAPSDSQIIKCSAARLGWGCLKKKATWQHYHTPAIQEEKLSIVTKRMIIYMPCESLCDLIVERGTERRHHQRFWKGHDLSLPHCL